MENKTVVITNKVILNLIQYLQRLLLLLLLNSTRGISRIQYGMTPLCNNGGFTLIELLVVILIIGVLAAVALPQYQVAVARSRYAGIKQVTETIVKAQELYYLENGEYADRFDELSINIPESRSSNSPLWIYFDGGSCMLSLVSGCTGRRAVKCITEHDNLYYFAYFHNACSSADKRACLVSGNSNVKKVCEVETQNTSYTMSGGLRRYSYQ